jgi:hypothetical protein
MTLEEGERVVAFERLAESDNEQADALAAPDAAATATSESDKPPASGGEGGEGPVEA